MSHAWSIRSRRDGEHGACEQIMRGLQQWFGIESAIEEYAGAISRLPTWIAEADRQVVGFLTLHEHNDVAAEVHVMAVRSEWRGRGVGRSLVEEAEWSLRERGFRLLQVKTLAPSRPDAHYEQTRGFYRRMGFLPLEENRLWGEANPCLIMVKAL